MDDKTTVVEILIFVAVFGLGPLGIGFLFARLTPRRGKWLAPLVSMVLPIFAIYVALSNDAGVSQQRIKLLPIIFAAALLPAFLGVGLGKRMLQSERQSLYRFYWTVTLLMLLIGLPTDLYLILLSGPE